ncbi:serine hydrolase [Jannaschia sp. M317]|uniref:serine hydrolase domain-containing protein n=1 Tax=Jannaschia sp. M317 TaxID=2867011 RepID=UPI0021A43059|nr:serine hydrolase domain-containing protein [Jannaschia sp. M317]UWQ16396.1 beta-lactamase family protein [Jannaschia sp. M317]
MKKTNAALQDLLQATLAHSTAHGLLLRVQSGDGKVDFRGSAGNATPDSRFPIASISKVYTAAIIHQLVDEGRLCLDQTVQSALPDVDLTGLHVVKGVDYGPCLTIRQLVFQTSGLADYYEGGVAADVIRSKDYAYDLGRVLRWTKEGTPQAVPDSGRAHYSDTNFQLLGGIIETATGLSFGDALQSRICARLDLRRTAVFDPVHDGNDQTLPVYHKDLRLGIPRILSSMGPDGGIVSDTDDLITVLRRVMAGHLFQRQNLPAMCQWRPLSFPLQYGGGLMRFKLPGWMTLWRPSPELIGHSGASGTFAYHAPKADVFLVGTFNQTDAPKRPFSFMLEVLKIIQRHEDMV